MPALKEATCSTAFTVLSAVNSFDSICKLLTTFTCFYQLSLSTGKSKASTNFSLVWFGYKISELAIAEQGKLGQMGILGKLIVVYDD